MLPSTPPEEPKIAEASNEGEQALAGFRIPAGLKGELWAAEPMLANPVAFCFDNRGRIFVCETFRQKRGIEDNRDHAHWLDDDLAAQTVEDRLAYIKKHLGEKANEYTKYDDRVRLLEDTDGAGRANKATVFADRFNGILDGTAAGVLFNRGNLYLTCIPHLWQLKDTDGDGRADVRNSLSYGYGVRFAFRGHDMHGLVIGPDGRLYFSIGDRGLNVERDGHRLINAESGVGSAVRTRWLESGTVCHWAPQPAGAGVRRFWQSVHRATTTATAAIRLAGSMWLKAAIPAGGWLISISPIAARSIAKSSGIRSTTASRHTSFRRLRISPADRRGWRIIRALGCPNIFKGGFCSPIFAAARRTAAFAAFA